MNVIYVILAGPLIWYFFKLVDWFLQPAFEGCKNEEILKEYTFIDPRKGNKNNNNTRKKFGTINDKPTKSISIVVPAYNEEDRIRPMLDSTIKYLEIRSKNAGSKSAFNWEIIVVNDGSTDNTCNVINQYCKKYGTDYVRLLSYDINQGKGYAVQQGMLHARGCFILYADADGATQIEYLWNLENELARLLNEEYNIETKEKSPTNNTNNNKNKNKNNRNNKKNTNNNNNNNNSSRKLINYFKYSKYNGVSVGSRKDLQKEAEANRTFFRNLAMWGFHYCVKYIGGVSNIRDTQCGFKMFTRNAVKNIFYQQKIRRWCFDVELLMIAQMQNMSIIEVGVKWDEIPGSKLSVIKASLSMFRELIIIRFFRMIGRWYLFNNNNDDIKDTTSS